MYALSIDPGVEFGWALWKSETWHVREAPEDARVVIPPPYEWQERVEYGWNELLRAFHGVTDVYCEWPMYFGAASSAPSGTGDLLKLMFQVGGVARMTQELGARFHPIPVNDWKGQMPKSAVISRIKKRLPGAEYNTHAWDAVGIGLYAKGYF